MAKGFTFHKSSLRVPQCSLQNIIYSEVFCIINGLRRQVKKVWNPWEPGFDMPRRRDFYLQSDDRGHWTKNCTGLWVLHRKKNRKSWKTRTFFGGFFEVWTWKAWPSKLSEKVDFYGTDTNESSRSTLPSVLYSQLFPDATKWTISLWPLLQKTDFFWHMAHAWPPCTRGNSKFLGRFLEILAPFSTI